MQVDKLRPYHLGFSAEAKHYVTKGTNRPLCYDTTIYL